MIVSMAPGPAPMTAPVEVDRPIVDESLKPDFPWLVVVWNDPINLMAYVTFVFQKLFGYSKAKAHGLMLDVHYKGRAVVSSGAAIIAANSSPPTRPMRSAARSTPLMPLASNRSALSPAL